MEIIQHNRQITTGTFLVCIQNAPFGVKLGDCLKVAQTRGIDKVQFVVPDRVVYLVVDGRYRFRKAYKNESNKVIMDNKDLPKGLANP